MSAQSRMMAAASSADELEGVVSRVQLVGGANGLVKKLGGFDRSRHSVPDAVNPATTNFLARLCQAELAAEAEGWFQRARAAMQYKRKDLALDVTSPTAVLTARDFVFELSYELLAEHPEEFRVSRMLHQLADLQLVRTASFDDLFAGQFTDICFMLRRGVQVEAVIDAVEAADGQGGLSVEYPSDCRFCTIRVEDVEAEVCCDGASIAMQFPRGGSPSELLDAFAQVRGAFSLSKQGALSGLIC